MGEKNFASFPELSGLRWYYLSVRRFIQNFYNSSGNISPPPESEARLL
ncbi:hypothetical protein NSP_7050 [Nodularia spumigena CCY9414]|nr:hypothetical protein NSP_7050 [Nodularia spumigena CCY9414]